MTKPWLEQTAPKEDPRRFAPATERNREPILEVLRRVVKDGERVLEIASGSGEHAIYVADRLPIESWQPSDPDAEARASIEEWRRQSGAQKVLRPIELDVMRDDTWPHASFELVVCINMIHIAPWEATVALMRGAARVLGSHGRLFLYGPYKRDGAHTAPTNELFDRNLRARNASWGVRDLEAVRAEAEKNGFSLAEIVPMPANNFSLIFEKKVELTF
jgi:cyclopropane fatty-acyl-phospholipid synthase-like methyltransferase